MNIAFNAQLLSLTENYRNAGVSKYIYHLLDNLNIIDKQNKYLIFMNKCSYRDISLSNNYKCILTNLNTSNPFIRVLWEQIVLPLELRNNVDLLHCPVNVVPFICSAPSIVTINDLTNFIYPETFRKINRVYLTTLTKISVQKAKRIIAISQNTKNDIVRILKIPEEKIVVVYDGVDDNFYVMKNKDVLSNIRKKYFLPEKFILFVGTLEPRKNVQGLLKAFVKLKAYNNINHKLVLVGSKGWLYNSFFNLVSELQLKKDIMFLDYVPDKDLPAIYNLADLFVYPSFYEGFGLPVLESMACGCPVITSNTSSLPEVVGDAGIMINPFEIDALAEAMYKVLTNYEFKSRIIEKGLIRIKKFNWKKCAEETLKVYEEVCSKR